MSVSRTGDAALLLDRQFASTLDFAGVGTLAQAPLGGGAPRELLAQVEYADWGPDGTLAVVRHVGGRARLEYPIGTVRYESRAERGWISHPRVSGAGEWVAFIDHPWVDDAGAIVVVDRQGHTRRLSEGWFAAQGLTWLRNDREIWFTATAAGVDRAVHAVDLSGRHRLVLRVPGTLTVHDVSSSGRVLLTRDTLRGSLGVLTQGEPRERDLSWLDFSILSDLSADGTKVVFGESGAGVGSKMVIYSRVVDGSPAVRLGDGIGGTLSPDGRWLLAYSQDRKRLQLWPTGAGEAQTLARHQIESYSSSTWFPDGRSILITGREPGHQLRVYVQRLDGEAPRPLTSEGYALYEGSSSVSPDGRTVVMRDANDRAVLYAVKEGMVQLVPGVVAGDRPMRWTADGRMLLVFRPGLPARMYRVDVRTGQTDGWKEIMPADPAGVFTIGWMEATADGQTYAYSYMQLLSDLFLVDGLK